MEQNLSERYNDGLVPAPKLDVDPRRLRPPAWLPGSAQLQTARRTLKRNLLILAGIIILIGTLVEWLFP
jgi:hypothetical protein